MKSKIPFLQTLCWVISMLIISRVFDDLIFARNPQQLQTNHTHYKKHLSINPAEDF